jgi:excisionase family DNA binding protein
VNARNQDELLPWRPLLTVRMAGTYTGLGERYIRRLRAERRIPCVRIGGRLLFDPDDLDRFIESHRQPAARP